MTEEFRRELEDSLYVHRPLPLHRERETETKRARREASAAVPIRAVPVSDGAALDASDGAWTITAPLRCDPWPKDTPGDVGYRNFGTARLVFRFDREDWERFDRLRFSVLPRIEGARVLHLNAAIVSRGREPVPDRYWREGATVFDLAGGEWNDCTWDFGDMPRDAVCELQLYVFCAGHDTAAGDSLAYSFRDLRLEVTGRRVHTLGWENPEEGVRYSSVGYFPEGEKTAIASTDADTFSLLDAESGEARYEGEVRRVTNERGRFAVLDFSAVREEGVYRIRVGEVTTPPFPISREIRREALWRAVNFLFCQRCGFPVPGKHGACHLDFLAEHNGESVPFHGGWHDAGDTSQQAAQTAETVEALFANAALCRDDPLLYRRLTEEGEWGLDFILRTRFGDGFRATSAGSTRWSDNRIGTFDDVACRVFDHSYENFLFAGAETAASREIRRYDSALADCALRAAREDFAFAEVKFRETGVDPAHMFEHTYNSGLSQYYAVIVRSASLLFRETGDDAYARTARETAGLLLACQERGGRPFDGFFCREPDCRTPVHFNHQAREHQFAEALALLCETQPDAPERETWENALRLYGGYLRFIAGNTAPWGMLPAGIHRRGEEDDEALFPYLHVTCDWASERENYRAQLDAGRDLGDGWVLRNFPVWFSFRGNSAVLLSAGRAAGVAGHAVGDGALAQLCREQLYWLWGKNPFGQSFVYGAGHDFCRQYTVHMGDTAGAIPVGVETRGNGDEPYWPTNNNATFREIWIGAVCRYLEVLAECAKEEHDV